MPHSRSKYSKEDKAFWNQFDTVTQNYSPEEGDTMRGVDIGYKSRGLYIYTSCERCGKLRWVILRKGKAFYKICSCWKIGVVSNSWKGGKVIDRDGYTATLIHSSNPFYRMARRTGYVLTHRLVMAEYLGRCLEPSEVVHHKNGVRWDNRVENLELVSKREHESITILENKIRLYEKKIILLEAEIILLNRKEEKSVTTSRG